MTTLTLLQNHHQLPGNKTLLIDADWRRHFQELWNTSQLPLWLLFSQHLWRLNFLQISFKKSSSVTSGLTWSSKQVLSPAKELFEFCFYYVCATIWVFFLVNYITLLPPKVSCGRVKWPHVTARGRGRDKNDKARNYRSLSKAGVVLTLKTWGAAKFKEYKTSSYLFRGQTAPKWTHWVTGVKAEPHPFSWRSQRSPWHRDRRRGKEKSGGWKVAEEKLRSFFSFFGTIKGVRERNREE